MSDSAEVSQLRLYRKFVNETAKAAEEQKRPSEPFLTRHSFHAAVVVNVLFQLANEVVQILTKQFSPEIYGTTDIDLTARDFLERSFKRREGRPGIIILYEDDIDIKSRTIIKSVSDYNHAPFKNSIKVMQVPKIVRDTYSFHFMVVDGIHFRFTELRDQVEALNQFNQPVFGAELRASFCKIWEQSEANALPHHGARLID